MHGEFPLEPGGEAGSTTTSQAAADHLGHYLSGFHLGEDFGQRLVAFTGDVLLDLERVDDPGVAQDDLDLPVEEVDVAHLGDRSVGAGSVADQPGDDPAFEKVLRHDLFDVFDLDVLVEDSVWVDQHHGSHRARSQAAGLDDLVGLAHAQALELLSEGGADLKRTGGDASASRANEYLIDYLLHCISLDIPCDGRLGRFD